MWFCLCDKKFRRIASGQRRFGVGTWWTSASSGGDGRATATKIQPPSPHPPSPLPLSPPFPSPPLLPPPRLIVEESKGDRGGGPGLEKDQRPAELLVQAHQCALVWLVMFCCDLSKTSASQSHATTHHGAEATAQLVRSPHPKTGRWPAAPVHSAFRVVLCRASVTRLKEKQKALRSCLFCLCWANTFFGSHSTSTPSILMSG